MLGVGTYGFKCALRTMMSNAMHQSCWIEFNQEHDLVHAIAVMVLLDVVPIAAY